MIVDANVNVGACVYDDWELEPSLAAYQEWMEQAAVDQAIVSPLKPPSLDFTAANEWLADAVQGVEHLSPVARIDPRLEDSADTTDELLSTHDFVGLKLHPWEESFSITATTVEPIFEVARQHDVPVWIHAGHAAVSHALSVREVAQMFPEVAFVVTHGGHLDISGLSLGDALVLARETENTYFELSGIYRHDFIQQIIAKVGPSRVCFGSNAPYFHPTVELARVQHADIEDAERQHVLGESITRLLE